MPVFLTNHEGTVTATMGAAPLAWIASLTPQLLGDWQFGDIVRLIVGLSHKAHFICGL